MSTDAQFKKGEIVWYWRDNVAGHLETTLACITEVTEVNPAQYHVWIFDTSETTTCGEGIEEPGAVSKL